MKKSLLAFLLTVFCFGFARAQCVPTCSNYVAVPTTYSVFPNTGISCAPLFVGQGGLPPLDDGLTPLINIGFTFNYYCTNYTQVLICTNGFIQFNIGAPPNLSNGVNPPQNFPDPTAPNGIVAFDMEDFDITSGGSITYTTVGAPGSQMFIVTYSNVPMWKCSTVVNTGQIVLHETSNIIEIHTGVVGLGCYNGTQGIENQYGTAGVVIPGRSIAPWTGGPDAYIFYPVTPLPPSPISGNTSPCEGVTGTYSTPTIAGVSTYSWTFPSLSWQGSSTTTAVSTTVGSAGTISVTATYTCGTSQAGTLNVSSVPAPAVSIISANPAVACSGDTFTIIPAGALTYTVNPGNYTSSGANTPIVITAGASDTFSLFGTDATNCVSYNLASTFIQVNPSPTVTVNSGSICAGQSFTLAPTGADSYIYSGGFPVVYPPTTGTFNYSVTGVNLNNCQSLVPIISTVIVNANPTLAIVPSKPAICKNEAVVLTASGANTYSWSNGASTNVTSPTLTTSTTFTVTGTSPEGCSKIKTINIAVYACTGIEELSGSASGLEIYPNPATGVFNLKLESVNSNASLEVYDATGRLIQTRKADVPEFRLDLTDQPRGLYYMKVKNGDATQTLKLIKE